MRKKKAASVPDASYTRKVQVVREFVNIPKVIHGRVPNLAWQLGQIGSQVGTQVGPQVGPKLATVNHPNDLFLIFLSSAALFVLQLGIFGSVQPFGYFPEPRPDQGICVNPVETSRI